MATWAIILAGGAGTRFWPASTPARPKQLLPLVHPNETLLATTLRRIRPFVPPDHVIVATGERLVEATREGLPAEVRVLAEPVPRNTAPCVAWATATVLEADPDALCMVLPSDHAIADEAGFRACVEQALETARGGWLTTLGITPTRPETGFGYIERGEPLGPHAFRAARFVEKPDHERAAAYLATGRFSWNAGMFFFGARDMMAAFHAHAPTIAQGARDITAHPERLPEDFAAMPSISIDHAVMEKAERVAVVPGDFGWNDLGSWQSAWELADKDTSGNVLPPGAVAVDAKNVLVWDRTGKPRTYAVLGLSDIVLIETEHAVLVAPRDRAQDVRLIVERLRSEKP